MEEWLESGECGDIERRFGVNKRFYSLGSITAKLKHTAEEPSASFVHTFELLTAFSRTESYAVDTIINIWGGK